MNSSSSLLDAHSQARSVPKRRFNELNVHADEDADEIQILQDNKLGEKITKPHDLQINDGPDADNYDRNYEIEKASLQKIPKSKKKKIAIEGDEEYDDYPNSQLTEVDLLLRNAYKKPTKVQRNLNSSYFAAERPSTSFSSPVSDQSLPENSYKFQNNQNSVSNKFHIDLSDEIDRETYEPLSIYIGRGISMELKEFRVSYYVGLSKQSTVSSEMKNRFNIPLDLLKNVFTASDTMLKHIKKNRKASKK